MIHVETAGPMGPEYERWRAKARVARDRALAAWRLGERPDLRPKVWQEIKQIFLLKAFRHKCAYCEGRHKDGFALHVEHYRPKLEVTEQRLKINHPGYFWIAYEWWNLVPSCAYCNSSHTDGKEHPGKASEFRVIQDRVCSPSDDPQVWEAELSAEGPLLLNPFTDHPEEHIDFDEFGFPFPKNGSTRGRETIDVCHLDRPSLIEARMDQLGHIRSAIDDLIRNAPNDPTSHSTVAAFEATAPFSLWRRRKAQGMLSSAYQAVTTTGKQKEPGNRGESRTVV